jgi:hypothetical protein
MRNWSREVGVEVNINNQSKLLSYSIISIKYLRIAQNNSTPKFLLLVWVKYLSLIYFTR